MLTVPSPSEQSLPPPPAFWQRGWLRWPLAWTLATLLSLGMLAALTSVSRPWVRIASPARLAVALFHATPSNPGTTAPAAAAPHARPLPARAAPLASPIPGHPDPILTTPAATPIATAPAPQVATVGAAVPGVLATPALAGTSTPSPGGHASAPASGRGAVTDLPLRQRCPQQVKPVFPRRALEDGIEQGRVLARLYLETDGRVRAVQIIEASPSGYFEAEARAAALQWHCLPGGQSGDAVRVPFVFGME